MSIPCVGCPHPLALERCGGSWEGDRAAKAVKGVEALTCCLWPVAVAV